MNQWDEVRWAISALKAIEKAPYTDPEPQKIPLYGQINRLTIEQQQEISERLERVLKFVACKTDSAYTDMHAIRKDPEPPF